MKRLLSSITAVVVVGSSTASVVACNNSESGLTDKEKMEIATYQAALWQVSPEHIAGEATEFNNAVHQYDAVIAANLNDKNGDHDLAVNNDGQDNRIVHADKITATAQGDKYKVTYDLTHKEKAIPAVIVDLDETFMDNSLNDIYNALNGTGYTTSGFHKWVEAMAAPLYTNVIHFVEHVWESGGIVLFDSDRNMGDKGGNGTGDEMSFTRANLIKDGYPEAFLDSYTWWMMGVMEYGDQGQTPDQLAKLKSKEDRYNYLNASATKLQTRSMAEMNLKASGDKTWTDVNDNSQFTNQANVKIVMKMGDDLNDFNSNLLTSGPGADSLKLRQDYIMNRNVLDLYGGVAPAVWFEKVKNQIIEHIASHDSEFQDDQSLKTNAEVQSIVDDQNPLLQTYSYVAGNADYGHWLNTFQSVYGNNISGMQAALQDYFDQHNGGNIWGH